MAKTPLAVQQFEDGILEKVSNKAKAEIQILTDLKRSDTGNESAIFNQWDQGYYTKMHQQKEFDYDSEVAREYFPIQHVTQTTMDIYQELLGFKFAQI